jgi:hypothetical protein
MEGVETAPMRLGQTMKIRNTLFFTGWPLVMK